MGDIQLLKQIRDLGVGREGGFLLLDALIAISIISAGVLLVLGTYSNYLIKRQDWYRQMETSRIFYEESADLNIRSSLRSTDFSEVSVEKGEHGLIVSDGESTFRDQILSVDFEVIDHPEVLLKLEEEQLKSKEKEEEFIEENEASDEGITNLESEANEVDEIKDQ